MRYLVSRISRGWGDIIVITSLFSYLKESGNEVYVLTSAETGIDVLMHNPNIDKIIPYVADTVPISKLDEFVASVSQAYECDKTIELTGSLEMNLALHRTQPDYNLPKQERIARCNRNYYDETFRIAGFPNIKGRNGEIYFADKEHGWGYDFFRPYQKMFKILWGLAGSGRNKAYPAVEFVMLDLLKRFDDLMIITVGDDKCKVLETINHPRVLHCSGEWNYRQSMMACKFVNLVVCPDTGLLHSAGSFTTPKIGLLGHTTKENITKYFINDYSLEADCSCSPCFRLIYNAVVQCPIDERTGGCWCMVHGLKATRVYNRIAETILANYDNRKTEADRVIIGARNKATGETGLENIASEMPRVSA